MDSDSIRWRLLWVATKYRIMTAETFIAIYETGTVLLGEAKQMLHYYM